MYLAARAARAGLAHFPEIVVAVAVDDMRFGKMLLPIRSGLIVALKTLGGITLEDRRIKARRVKVQDVYKILPGPVDGFLLEVIAERPVAQHLEHCMMVGVVTHLLKVIMFSGHTQTLLAVSHTAALGGPVAEDNVFKLIHAGIGEHQCRVILNHHRSRGHNLMTALLKKALERFSDFVRSHHILMQIYFYQTVA